MNPLRAAIFVLGLGCPWGTLSTSGQETGTEKDCAALFDQLIAGAWFEKSNRSD